MSQKIKVGIIGYGLAGRVFHAPLINAVKGFELKKISTSDKERQKQVEAKYPEVEVVQNSHAIIEDSDIDLVVIATPNEFHYTQALEALNSGKHVVIDKPFAITTAEGKEIIATAEKKNKLVTAFQNRRWDGDFLTVKKVIESKQLGDIVEAEIHYDRFRNYIKPGTWKEEDRPGAGIIYDLGSHIIDQALVLFGIPQSITAFMLSQRQGTKAFDNFEIVFHYPALKVTIKAGMLVRARIPRYILLGTKGSFVKYGLDPQEAQLNAGMLPGELAYGADPEADYGTLRTDIDGEKFNEEIIPTEKGDYIQFYENVYKAISGDENLYVKPAEAMNTIKVIELALQSHEERRTVNWL